MHFNPSESPLETGAERSNSSVGAPLEAKVSEEAHGSASLENVPSSLSTVSGEQPAETKRTRFRAKPKFPMPVAARALLIDLDGTLIDTAADIAAAVNRMRAAFGFGPLDALAVRNMIGRGTAHLVSQAMKNAVGELGASASKVAVAQFEKQYEACLAESSRPYPGAYEALERFTEKGFLLACVTNKAERFTTPLLAATDLARYFKLVVCGDTVAEKKPHPLPISHAAKALGVPVETCVMIGDSMHDAAAARAAGAPVFIVPYGYNEGQELRGLDCDVFLDDLPSALKYVKLAA
jgi:phosphoglycolate phosphatase